MIRVVVAALAFHAVRYRRMAATNGVRYAWRISWAAARRNDPAAVRAARRRRDPLADRWSCDRGMRAMGAEAYASGDGVAFARAPDLHTAAADIASLGTGAIYEIKPYIPTEITSGLAQVAAYVAAAIASCGVPPAWHLGFAYPDSVIPFGNMELVAKQYGHPGLILYYTRKKREQPTYEKVLEIVLLLGLSISMVAVILAALADPEPATKLALAGLSVVMIATLLEKLGMAEPAPQA